MLSEVNVSLFSSKEDSKLNTVINALIVCVIVVLILEIFFSASYSGIYVVGSSMNDTLTGAEEHFYEDMYVADTSGDYVYVKKNASPDYGDIVVITKTDKTTIIKRVIAKGGDFVKMDHGKVYVKHSAEEDFKEPLEEIYVSPKNNSPSYHNNTFYNDENGYFVKEGYYFVLGDNRDVSLDSREGGGTCFSDEQIYGVVTEWSLNGKSFYTRLHKFFSFDLPRIFGIDNRVKRPKTDSEV